MTARKDKNKTGLLCLQEFQSNVIQIHKDANDDSNLCFQAKDLDLCFHKEQKSDSALSNRKRVVGKLSDPTVGARAYRPGFQSYSCF